MPGRAPYIDEICAAIADPLIDQVTVTMGTQMSKTEGTQLNVLGWMLEDQPAPAIYVGPTQSLVTKIARPKGRFDQMIASVPELAERIDPRDQRAFERHISGVPVIFAWAGSDAEVASNAAKWVLIDEFDKMNSAVLENARSRGKTYFGFTLIVVSTPTIAGASNIEDQFEEGTRERWHWRCPHCAEWFYPRLALLKWPKDTRGLELRAGAYVQCPHCEGAIREEERDGLEARYFATQPPGGDGGDFDHRLDIRPALSHRSFSVSGLCTWSQSLGQTAEIYARALRSRDPDRIREVTNDQGGEVYRLRGDSPGWAAVWALREGYERPPGAKMVTIGADPAGNRIDYVVRAWGWQAESWLIEAGTLYGDTSLDDVFLALQGLVRREWWGMPVSLALVDSGYRPSGVYAAARREPNLSPSKGHETADRRYWDSLVDETSWGAVAKVGVRLWHVSVAYWAGWLYGRIRWPAGAPGAWHVHTEITEDYARQVTNEEMVELASGGVKWIKTGNRQNHYGDCERLAAAAAHICNVEQIAPPESGPAPTRPRRRGSSAFQRHGL